VPTPFGVKKSLKESVREFAQLVKFVAQGFEERSTGRGMSVPVRGGRVAVYGLSRRGLMKESSNTFYRVRVERPLPFGLTYVRTVIGYTADRMTLEPVDDSTVRVGTYWGSSGTEPTWTLLKVPVPFWARWAKRKRSASPDGFAGCWYVHWGVYGRTLPYLADILELRTTRATFASAGEGAYDIGPGVQGRPNEFAGIPEDTALKEYWEHSYPECWWRAFSRDSIEITLRRPAERYTGGGRRIVMTFGPANEDARSRGFELSGKVYTYRENATMKEPGPQDEGVWLKRVDCQRWPA
jgi:hypothetical protein